MSGIGGFDIYAVMSEALGCLCEGLAETPAGRPCRCTLAVGTNLIPVDACACEGPDCGMAWVRLDAAFPSSTFPAADTTATSCTSPLAYRFNVGVVRCQPGMDESGNLPTDVDQVLAAQAAIDDMQVAYRAAMCCLRAIPAKQRLLGSWMPVAAPDGGCAGGLWPVTVWGL